MVLAAMLEAETGMSEMVKAAVLLAPIAYMEHMKSKLLSLSAALMLDTVIYESWIIMLIDNTACPELAVEKSQRFISFVDECLLLEIML